MLNQAVKRGQLSAPSGGAQGAKSLSVSGTYGPGLISKSTVPGAKDTMVCQVPQGISAPYTGPAELMSMRSSTLPWLSKVKIPAALASA